MLPGTKGMLWAALAAAAVSPAAAVLARAGRGTEGVPVAPGDGAPAVVGVPAYGTYAWPVRGPVVRGFDPPGTPYGSGHRGIDIAAPMGTPVRAAHDGVVAFAGWVAGALYVSIDHPDGVRTTYSWLSGIRVGPGEAVRRGRAVGQSGGGHPGSDPPHLHFGARIGPAYVDPMLLLERGSLVGLIRLAPLEDARTRSAPAGRSA